MDAEIKIINLETINIKPDDVILWKFDADHINLDKAHVFFNFLKTECFPDYKVIAIEQHSNLEVFHEEDVNGDN